LCADSCDALGALVYVMLAARIMVALAVIVGAVVGRELLLSNTFIRASTVIMTSVVPAVAVL
jgi:hypothetical protein